MAGSPVGSSPEGYSSLTGATPPWLGLLLLGRGYSSLAGVLSMQMSNICPGVCLNLQATSGTEDR